MHFGICPLSIVPVRSSASHKSEQLSQLLFGELVEVLEKKGKQWSRVRCEADNFVGWVASNQLKAITPSEFEHFQQHYSFCLEHVQPVMADNRFVPVTMGARLPDFDGIRFKVGEEYLTFSGQAINPADIRASADFIIKIAKRYLNTPFAWGGRSPFGIDSAALTQLVFGIAGIRLPREPEQQLDHGHTVDFMEQSAPGDIAFFENKAGRINHVGIIMEERRIIHAYGSVRIDLVDHYGIYDEEQQKYTHRLRLARRILPTIKRMPRATSNGTTSNSIQVELF